MISVRLLILTIANFGKVSATAVSQICLSFLFHSRYNESILFPLILNSAPEYVIKREKEQEMIVNECLSFMPVCV